MDRNVPNILAGFALVAILLLVAQEPVYRVLLGWSE